MRHRIHHRKLNRTSEHRTAMFRNMAQSLVEHGRITTTIAKAKDLRPIFEKLVTLAVRVRKLTATNDAAGALRARRALHKVLGDRGIVPKEHRGTYNAMSEPQRARSMRMPSGRRYRTGEPKGRLAFTAESVTHRLIETIAPRFEDRPGGYTRVVRLAKRRVGDHSALAMIQLVGDEEPPTSLTKPAPSARKRKADARYAMTAKVGKLRRQEQRASKSDTDVAVAEESADADVAETKGSADSDS